MIWVTLFSLIFLLIRVPLKTELVILYSLSNHQNVFGYVQILIRLFIVLKFSSAVLLTTNLNALNTEYFVMLATILRGQMATYCVSELAFP